MHPPPPPPAGPGAGLGVSRCIRSISEVFWAPGREPETALGPTGTLSFPPGHVHGMGVTGVSAACLHPPRRVHGSQRTSPISKQLRITSKGGKNKEILQPERSWCLAPICLPLIFLDGEGAKPATKPRKVRARPGLQMSALEFPHMLPTALHPGAAFPCPSSAPLQAFLSRPLPPWLPATRAPAPTNLHGVNYF